MPWLNDAEHYSSIRLSGRSLLVCYAEHEFPRHISHEQMTAFNTILEKSQSELNISKCSANKSTLEVVFIQRRTTLSHEADDELKAAYKKLFLLFLIWLEEIRTFDASNYACKFWFCSFEVRRRTKREIYSLHRCLRRR
jgi:hypothetical protein